MIWDQIVRIDEEDFPNPFLNVQLKFGNND